MLSFDRYNVMLYYIWLGDVIPWYFPFKFPFFFPPYLKKRNPDVVVVVLTVSWSFWVALITTIGLTFILSVIIAGDLNCLSFACSHLGHVKRLWVVFVFWFLLALWSSWFRECNPFQDGIGRSQTKGMCFMFSQEIIGLSLLPNLSGSKLNHCLKNQRYY